MQLARRAIVATSDARPRRQPSGTPARGIDPARVEAQSRDRPLYRIYSPPGWQARVRGALVGAADLQRTIDMAVAQDQIT